MAKVITDKSLNKALQEWARSEEVHKTIKTALEKELAKVLRNWARTGKLYPKKKS